MKNPKVDFYFNKAKKWQDEVRKLRTIILNCGLTEELKWGCPCYTFQKDNIVLIHDFKEYCALLFFKGALLLHDADGILIRQTENVQSARQIRFTNIDEVIEREAIIKAYVFEAVEVEKAGLEVAFKKTADFKVVEEFQDKLDGSAVLKTAFEALTPGRQKHICYIFLRLNNPKPVRRGLKSGYHKF